MVSFRLVVVSALRILNIDDCLSGQTQFNQKNKLYSSGNELSDGTATGIPALNPFISEEDERMY